MFTGIVEGVGKVISLDEEEQSWCFKLDLPFQDCDGLDPGASLAVNGCCLTFREQADKIGTFDLLEETLSRTNLGKLKTGDLVNLERPVPVGGRMGGHFVSGHVDGVGEVEVLKSVVKIYISKSLYHQNIVVFLLIKAVYVLMVVPLLFAM